MSKRWFASGFKMVSSYGNVNYSPSQSALNAGLAAVFSESNDYVVIDGDDDWYAPKIAHPDVVASVAEVPIVGLFHSGISGISSSGIVILARHYEAFKTKYLELVKVKEYTDPLKPNLPFTNRRVHLNVYFSDSSMNEVLKTF